MQPDASVRICIANKQIDERQGTFGEALRRLDESEKTGATFLITDLDLAMTLAQIARDAAEGSEKRNRNRANARHAYDDVLRISHRALLTDNEWQNVAELRSALERLGEVLHESYA